MTEADLTKLRSFHTICLRRILRIFWPKRISNEDLLRRCQQQDMGTIITRRWWQWIGHILRMDPQSPTALHWAPDGKRKRGRSRTTWRRPVESEMGAIWHSWGSLTRLAQDRLGWRDFVAAQHTTWSVGVMVNDTIITMPTCIVRDWVNHCVSVIKWFIASAQTSLCFEIWWWKFNYICAAAR